MDPLEGAHFLGVTWKSAPTEDELSRAASWAEQYELYLDLRLPALCSAVSAGAHRTARVIWEAPSISALRHGDGLARATTTIESIAGRASVRLQVEAEDRDALVELAREMGDAFRTLDLHVVPRDQAAHDSCLGRKDLLASVAGEARLNLSVSGIGQWRMGQPHDSLLAWNIQHTFLRALFQERPSLCPFPFTLLRREEENLFRLCPAPDGPTVSGGAEEDPWNCQEALDVRTGFMTGNTSGACRTCLLYPRVIQALRC
jgi:hypothetical protein